MMLAAYLSGQGYEVFFPHGLARADMIYAAPGVTRRVQCKTSTRSKAGKFVYEQCRLIKRGRKSTTCGSYVGMDGYTEDDVDEVWVLGTHIWCFPIKVVAGLSSLCLLNNGPTNGKPKAYHPDDHIVLRGTWDNPIRSFLGAS
jgi:hypothetical protein